jgi:hypothetical protein
MIWSDGSSYEGIWLFGKAANLGKFVYFDGDEFEGRWGSDKLTTMSTKQKYKNGYVWLLKKEKATPFQPNKAKFGAIQAR